MNDQLGKTKAPTQDLIQDAALQSLSGRQPNPEFGIDECMLSSPWVKKLQIAVVLTGGILSIALLVLACYYLNYNNAREVSTYTAPNGIVMGNTNRTMSERKQVFCFIVAFSALATKLLLKSVVVIRTNKILVLRGLGYSAAHAVFHLLYPVFLLGFLVMCFGPSWNCGVPHGWYKTDPLLNVVLALVFLLNTSLLGYLNVKMYQRRYNLH